MRKIRKTYLINAEVFTETSPKIKISMPFIQENDEGTKFSL